MSSYNRIDRSYQHSDLQTLFKRYEEVKSVGRHKRSLVGEADSWELKLTTPRRSLTVDVEVNVGLLRKLHYANPASFSSTFDASSVLKGRVSGQPDSSVRLTAMGNDLFEGRITYDDDEGQRKTLHIELVRSGTDLSAPQMSMIMYEDHDLLDKFRERPTCFEVPAPGGITEELWHSGLPSLAERAVNNIAIDQSAIEVECRPGETICPLMLSNIPRMSIFQMAQPATVGYGRDCPVAVVADITFSKMFGNDSERTILSLFNDVDSIYLEEFNVGTPIRLEQGPGDIELAYLPACHSYLYVVRNVDDPSGFGKPATSASDLLSQLQVAVLNKRLPSFNGACLVHLMTFQDFNPTLGLAYVSHAAKRFNVACTKDPHRSEGKDMRGEYVQVVAITPAFPPRYMEACLWLEYSTAVVTLAHELGHGMGSFHDGQHEDPPGNPPECLPPQPYIMYPSASTSSNSRKFSSCSQYSINRALNQIASCFVARNALTGLEENATPDLWYTAVIEAEDQCKAAPNLPKAPPSGAYEDCPYMLPTQYSCTLACLDPENPDRCLMFRDGSGRIRNKTDGTLCGSFHDQTMVCLGGMCRRDDRPNVCDRRKPCCNAYGILRNSTHLCRKAEDSGTCLKGYFCDSASEECPATVTPKRPGTPCSLQHRKCGPADDVGCGVCGDHAFEGQCLSRNSSAAANLTKLNWADWVEPDGTQHMETVSTPSSTGGNDVKTDGLPTWIRPTFIATGCVIGSAIVGAGGFFLVKKRLQLAQVDPGNKNIMVYSSSSMA
ncbi:uncharacterized protein SPPG_01785 [Spizellomyces punctatus DAOM BR117]|uniref:Peptidase M12B domain-containing protein n=1 Tax=Spizellomyces punctatus (strain DAOM BR117) TaxID=645134 RepID=A0A0L0HNP5_SPIPD|nr:uncharacterized protein SPPG_01785 [Spizellomyces punctatus DAOM BR117]KND02702.1 hypothetical protein SPPG_01785 [Spizellomyces punctatus DAOM BR117]|eukprot:XP_016610741.1 hypothetical protein SPPG_01785 [Spizellomyces punctatus DAOM BR117]